MRLARRLIVILFVLAAFCAGAQSYNVSFLEGEVRVRSGAALAGISIGDKLPPDSVVQLSEGAYLELNMAGMRIALSQKGTYNLHAISTSSRALGSAGVGTALIAGLSRLATGPSGNQGAVAGARAENKAKSEDSDWTTSNAQVYLDSGKEYIKSGQYDQAIGQLLPALDSTDESEAAEVHYYLADAYSLKGDTRNALKQAAGLKPGGGDDWAADFIILKAKLLVDTNAFAQEVSWLTQSGNDLSGDAQRAQMYLFLLGIGYAGAGDASNEKESLSRALSIAKESDIGKAASQLLQGL